jgi:ribosomal-protein-alanine N-acetyltransferase
MAGTPRLTLRRLEEADLDALDRIQRAASGASCWPVRDYLSYETTVAAAGAEVVGFLSCRPLAPGEREVLNLAVDPAWQRRGIGRSLLAAERGRAPAMLWLEVRASNAGALKFYKSLGFREISRRREYYCEPLDDAIVMSFSS